MAQLASIPSPSTGSLHLGPLNLNAYGLMIALGIVAATALAGRRLERAGAGTRDDMASIAVWAAVGGVIGARMYHVATDWSAFSGDLARIPLIWRGGLGIPGGLLGGVLGGLLAARRRGIASAPLLTAAAPAIPLGQAIGRWGNWWNQELFGRPTSLPWGLRIDPSNLPPGYAPGTLFHPTFLYESLWNLGLCGSLLLVERRCRLWPGDLFALYLIGYGAGRFWVEGLRIDPAPDIGPFRWNQIVALVAVAGGAGYLLLSRRRGRSAGVGVDSTAVPTEVSAE